MNLITHEKKFASKRASSITFPGIRKMLRMAEGIPNTISFAIGEPDFDTPDHIKEAGIKATREGFTKYTTNYGILELRQSIARKLKQDNGIDVDPKSEILVTVGVQEALYIIFQALLDPGDEVIVSDPCYHSYPRMIKLAGAEPVYARLNERDFSYDIPEVERRITPRTKMILLNSPQNPGGCVLSRLELEQLAALAEKHELVVVTDEIYEKLIYDATHISIASLPGMLERTITINGFSKAYAMTGWRIGYCVSPKEMLDEIIKIHAYSVTSASSISQKAALEALEGPQDSVAKMANEFKKRRDYIVRRLNDIENVSCPTPQGAFYAFANLSSFGMRSFELAEYLLKEAKIITVPGLEYGPSRDFYLRFSFATSMEKIEIGLDRLQNALDKLRQS